MPSRHFEVSPRMRCMLALVSIVWFHLQGSLLTLHLPHVGRCPSARRRADCLASADSPPAPSRGDATTPRDVPPWTGKAHAHRPTHGPHRRRGARRANRMACADCILAPARDARRLRQGSPDPVATADPRSKPMPRLVRELAPPVPMPTAAPSQEHAPAGRPAPLPTPALQPHALCRPRSRRRPHGHCRLMAFGGAPSL